MTVLTTPRVRNRPTARRDSNSQKHREMVEEWESWEPLIREDIQRLNHRLIMAQRKMSVYGARREVIEGFAIGRLKQLIKEECADDI